MAREALTVAVHDVAAVTVTVANMGLRHIMMARLVVDVRRLMVAVAPAGVAVARRVSRGKMLALDDAAVRERGAGLRPFQTHRVPRFRGRNHKSLPAARQAQAGRDRDLRGVFHPGCEVCGHRVLLLQPGARHAFHKLVL